MENENTNLQGNENEELTPEEKVQADISEKIADAAEEVKEEIAEANGESVEEEPAQEFDEEGNPILPDGNSEIARYDENGELIVGEETKPEPVKVNMKRSNFIVSLIGAAVVGALILFLCLNIPKWIASMPEGSNVVAVNGESITDLDLSYYIYTEAVKYAQETNISQKDIGSYDWDKEVDGKKLSDTIKQKAVDTAIDELITLQMGKKNGITLTEEQSKQVESQINTLSAQYGEEGFALRTRTMGIPTAKQYGKMYRKVMTLQSVEKDMGENPDKYYPSDKSVLNEYTQDDKASVKHILIKTAEDAAAEGEEAPEAGPVEDKKALAEAICQRAKGGEDFDELIKEYNQDTGEPDEGYTFGSGEMMPEFEEAAFKLKVDEISDVVETSYGYHIIKRVVGANELKAYNKAQNAKGIKINKKALEKISLSEIMKDIADATDKVQAESAAAGK